MSDLRRYIFEHRGRFAGGAHTWIDAEYDSMIGFRIKYPCQAVSSEDLLRDAHNPSFFLD